MAAAGSLPVVEATKSPRDDHPAPGMVDVLGHSDQSADLSANLPAPHDPPGATATLSSRLGPASSTQRIAEGDQILAPQPHREREDSIQDEAAPSRNDKGKAPETAPLQYEVGMPSNSQLHQPDSVILPGGVSLTGSSVDNEASECSVDQPESATIENGSNAASRAARLESNEASCASSLFEEEEDEEAQDYDAATAASGLAEKVPSWKQKQKQKAEPEAEAGPSNASSGASRDISSSLQFQPLSHGDPGWEKSAGRPPQKLPIRFRDAVGRNFIFPWEKAKTWLGMKRLVQSCFSYVDVIGPHVMAGRYDLIVALPYPMDSTSEIPPLVAPPAALSPSTTTTQPAPVEASASTTAELPGPSTAAAGGPSSAQDPSSSTSGSSNPSSQQQPRSQFVVLPELWEDTIEPGMLVVQHMWPLQPSTFAPQPPQPSPPQHHGPMGLQPGGRGRGSRGRGRGAGAGVFGGRGQAGAVGNNIFVPHPMPGHPRHPMLVSENKPRGKTRKRQEGL
ncbi:hypothetical protein F5Y19DRAFT_314334 [Xylariaceae sp. FL1651]|nr:hypothetical protein F5Y19DRAFT_314334 [Xylariaceae sp. FL1651]